MESDDMYHYDFTTASELEIFIARIEEIIQEWQLPQKPLQKKPEKNDFQAKEWCMVSEKLIFAEVEFQLVRYYLKCNEDKDALGESKSDLEDGNFSPSLDDMLSLENDFFPITVPPLKDSHPLVRWYGLRDFVVLIPKLSVLVASESQIKLWLSSLSIATNNTNCQVPFFIQVKEPWQCYFLGICQSKGFHTDFEMVHLKRLQLHYQYLTGVLVDGNHITCLPIVMERVHSFGFYTDLLLLCVGLLTLFKSKVGLGLVTLPVTVTVRFTYILKDWSLSSWTQNPPDLDFLEGEDIGVSELSKLPFGAVFDPIQGMTLYTTWPRLIENTIVDGESYSDLDAMQAPIWTATITSVENSSCLLTEYFAEFVALSNSTNTVQELLGNLIDSAHSKSNDLSSSLSAITESRISAFSRAVIGSEKSSRRQPKQFEQVEGPISADILMLLLYYLFPDADADCKSPYNEQFSGNFAASPEEDKSGHTLDVRLSGMKSAPYDSLPWRLAIVMAHVIHSLGGVQSATHLWYQFTQELRFRCEHNVIVPGLEMTFPDPRTCLLNQKLQLLNCCISKKIEREKRAKRTNDDSDSDEEFYDCSSDTETPQEDARKRKIPDKPTGRSARHGELRLLETGDFLYIPKTQDPIPKTEDQLEEDAEVLLQLGTDAHGSELRARLMSASLLSDMEAFKAANPGCILADFIRWYSPRDWIEDEGVDEFGQRKGHLSSRMEIPGNMWLEVWEIAKPVPIKRQRRLFNDTRESEKILDFFEQQNPKGFIELLLPVMSMCAIHKVIQESANHELPGVPDIIAKLIKKAERLQRSSNVTGDRYKDLINDVYCIETLLVQAQSLKRKFSIPSTEGEDSEGSEEELIELIKNLLTGGETLIPGGPRTRLRNIIRHYFAEASKIEQMKPDPTSALTDQKWNVTSPFQCPAEKEMILRCSTAKGPQRLHAVFKKNEYRLCGAFTKDDTFL